ncbi:MAG: DNA-binding protein [Sulfitobacter sp.]|uniref:DNA-binding protein n=1 Tax=Alphaproteobacteria TaxID=28211 RepID=UPI0029420F74|nr:DNA-binding protein [Sulfitobacter sp. LC.270.F.C4]WOI16685.1 DNA-binding protein [Sulfitobacter sp. LC.270.F.C4]
MTDQHPNAAIQDLTVDMSALPEERIAAVVDYFLKQGKPPTTRQVTTLAGVSNSGLKGKLPRIVEAVREEHRARAAIPDAPAAVSEGFARLWHAAFQAADASFDAHREDLSRKLMEAKAEAEGNFDALCQMEGERDHALSELKAVADINGATQAEFDEVKAKLAETEVKLSTAQARLEERESMLHKQLRDAKWEVKTSAERNADLETAVKTAENDRKKVAAGLDTVKAELSISRAKLDEAQQQVEELSKTASDVASLTFELDRVVQELATERANAAAHERTLLRTEARLEESQRVIDQLGVTGKASRPKGAKAKAPSGQEDEGDGDTTLELPFNAAMDDGAQAQSM